MFFPAWEIRMNISHTNAKNIGQTRAVSVSVSLHLSACVCLSRLSVSVWLCFCLFLLHSWYWLHCVLQWFIVCLFLSLCLSCIPDIVLSVSVSLSCIPDIVYTVLYDGLSVCLFLSFYVSFIFPASAELSGRLDWHRIANSQKSNGSYEMRAINEKLHDIVQALHSHVVGDLSCA